VSVLASGHLEIEGRMPWSSNGTFLCTLTDGPPEETAAVAAGEERDLQSVVSGPGVAAIYKPLRAERRLWDFPDGLYRREVAAYELAVDLGWDLVPETVERVEAPLGIGSVQRFVAADFEQHYFTLLEDERQHPALRRMAVFDVVANNADRKGGHCLLDAEGHVWGIDHGLCFHADPKLRTVIWDWAGETIDDPLVADLDAFARRGPSAGLRRLLHDDERDALVARVRALLRRPRLPEPRSERPYPWPLV
jgi:uncharacterized repeat protein (TIGR03843 family)